MFTGIIEHVGTIQKIEKGPGPARLFVKSSVLSGQKLGDSISVNGVCLTIADLQNDTAGFDVIGETLTRSNLKYAKIQDKVNIERALKVGDRMGGHFVSGHIDCVGEIKAKRKEADQYLVSVAVPAEKMIYVVEKGSVSLNGVSLTVAKIETAAFSVYLVPFTIKNTNLHEYSVSSLINIEFDLLGKFALNAAGYKQYAKQDLTEERVRKSGFVKA